VLAKKAGRRAVHQGVAALVSPVAYRDPGEVCDAAARAKEGLLVVLDGIEDPRNLGAVIRTAAAAGSHGILLGTEDTVGITPAAAKTSAGALERIGVAREPKLGKRLSALKQLGFMVAALDVHGRTRWDAVSYRGPVVVMAGGEGRGLRRGLLEAADHRVASAGGRRRRVAQPFGGRRGRLVRGRPPAGEPGKVRNLGATP
jgi:23S rRNA (guanosine2251-2'-O)-methyltransferase